MGGDHGLSVAGGSPGVAEGTLLVLNLSDLNKPYVRSMEYLDRVHGGSIGTEGDGY